MNGRKSIAYGLVLVAAAALLQGCGSGAGINELDARMTEIKARPRGRIEPPPEFKPIATYAYAARFIPLDALPPPTTGSQMAQQGASLEPPSATRPPTYYLERCAFRQQRVP